MEWIVLGGFVVIAVLLWLREQSEASTAASDQAFDGAPSAPTPRSRGTPRALTREDGAPVSLTGPPRDALVFDCETTGFQPRSHRMVSLAMVEVRDAAIVADSLIYLVFNPEQRVPEGARRVHGWDTDTLKRQPPFAAHADEVLARLAAAKRWVCHNTAFDVPFMEMELGNVGLALPRKQKFCTMRTARNLWPGEKATLDACLDRIGLRRASGLHSASEDAVLTAALYLHMHGVALVQERFAFKTQPQNFRP